MNIPPDFHLLDIPLLPSTLARREWIMAASVVTLTWIAVLFLAWRLRIRIIRINRIFDELQAIAPSLAASNEGITSGFSSTFNFSKLSSLKNVAHVYGQGNQAVVACIQLLQFAAMKFQNMIRFEQDEL
ncbi:hypothetical protein V2J09_019931 [Rumex salicifolius]